MTKTTFPPDNCVYCNAGCQDLRYHSRYQTLDGERIVFRCRRCRKTFNDRFGTAFYDLKTSSEKVSRAIQQVAEGLSFEAVARIEQVAPSTVAEWVKRGAEQAVLLDRELVQEIETEIVEMDEVYSFAGHKQKRDDENTDLLSETGKHWTHCSFARQTRLILAIKIGFRDEILTNELVIETASRLKQDCFPLWVTDGWKAYIFALVLRFHQKIYQIRRRGRGRPPKPKMIPAPTLRYGQVVKQRERGRVVGIEKRIIFGKKEEIDPKDIITSHLERLNGTMRLHCTPLHRKTRCFAKRKTQLEQQVTLFKSYYNFCLKHESLKYQTPAQATGINDKPLTMMELLNYGGLKFSKIS
jgi:transposase-like protein/IS1 family transposase